MSGLGPCANLEEVTAPCYDLLKVARDCKRAEAERGENMYRKLAGAERQLMFGVHDEWNVRELLVRPLMFGRSFVSWVFRDDGPVRNNRQRHGAIPMSFVLPGQIDWLRFKMNLWYHLERVKAYESA